jgi:hypothetical protein
MNESFGTELAALIAKHHPLALKGDAEALARVTGAMATTFGGLLAFSLRFQGKDHTLDCVRIIVKKMLEQGGMIGVKAENIMRSGE